MFLRTESRKFAMFAISTVFFLLLSSVTAADINECDKNNGGCEQNCDNTVGSFECSCDPGFTLNADMLNCDGMS